MIRNWKELTGRIQREDNLNDVFVDDVEGPGNGRHFYAIMAKDFDPITYPDRALLEIQFQEGGRNTEGSTCGVLGSDLLEIIRHRLQCFQAGPFGCRENACALTHIEEALMWMNKRKEDRKQRNVLGKHEK